MITEKNLRDLFEAWTGYAVKLHHGEVEETYRNINDIIKPVNGVMRVEAWTYTPIRTVAMATTTATATIIARSDEDAETVRKHLNDSVNAVRGTTIPVKADDGHTYALSIMAGSAYRDEAVHASQYGHGDEYDVSIRIEYIATANGVSSADSALMIDGEQIEVETMVSTMVGATDDQPGDDGVTQTAIPSRAFQMEVTAVLLNNGAGAVLMSEATRLDKRNILRCVEYVINGVSSFFMMVFTRAQLGSSELNNVGVTFSMATANPDVAVLGGNWSTVPQIGITTSIGAEPGDIVFWGDNTAERVGNTGMISHVYADGREEHTIHVYGGYNAPVTRELRIGDNLQGKRLIYIGEDWDVSGESDTTLIVCELSTLSIASGYVREMGENIGTISIGDTIIKDQEWTSSLDVVTGIRDSTLWHVYVDEMGV